MQHIQIGYKKLLIKSIYWLANKKLLNIQIKIFFIIKTSKLIMFLKSKSSKHKCLIKTTLAIFELKKSS